MTREAAGMATEVPMMTLAANGSVSDRDYVKELRYAQISHQTGALLIASDFQTTLLMNWIKQSNAVQPPKRAQPTFQAE